MAETFVKSEPEQMKVRAVNEPVMTKSEPIPEMPNKSERASRYPRLADIYNKLEKQNEAIYQREQQLVSVEKEITGTKGIFKGKQRGTAGTGGAVKNADSQYEAVSIKYCAGLWL